MGGGGLVSALRTPSREAVAGAGAEEARGGRGGGKRLRAAGGRGATDAEERDARGGRRLGAAARRGAQEARQARGDPESSMKSPRGRGRGAGLGRLSGGPRHSWQGGGRGGVLGVSRGLGGRVGRAGGGRPEWVAATRGPARAGPAARCQSAAPPRSPAESPARCRAVRWLFWKLANVFVEEGRRKRGSDRNRAWGRWNSRGQGRGRGADVRRGGGQG